MDTKLVTIFILSGILGAIIVITGCIKVLGKNGELSLKTTGFILAGLIFVALPVLGTMSIEWGDYRLFISTTNEKALELQDELDSLRVANSKLEEEIIRLKNMISEYGQQMSNPQVSHYLKTQATQKIYESIDSVHGGIEAVSAHLDSLLKKNMVLLNEIDRFEPKRQYRRQ